MQPAQTADSFVARSKIEMIRVAEQNLDAQIAERLLRKSLYCALRADRHERGRVNDAVRSRKTPQPGARRIGLQNFEAKFHRCEFSRPSRRLVGARHAVPLQRIIQYWQYWRAKPESRRSEIACRDEWVRRGSARRGLFPRCGRLASRRCAWRAARRRAGCAKSAGR